MFSNLLHQKNIVSRLRKDLSEHSLPPAILFSGSSMSGKLTAALETARILCCREEGSWQCSCLPCRQQRELNHQWTILAGSRDLRPEIASCADVLRRHHCDEGPRFLLLRAVRKLLRRLDPVLWEGEETKNAKLRAAMERLSEHIDQIVPSAVLTKALEKTLKTIIEDCGILQKALPSVLPIAQVRRIVAWSSISAGTDHKTIIIDAADRMPMASKNALLKFLEEPQKDTSIILLSERKSLLLPTITSRLRDYAFSRRTAEQEAEVLRRVFHEDAEQYGSLAAYFRTWVSRPSQSIRELAIEFIESAAGGGAAEQFDAIAEEGELICFLEALSIEWQTRWRKDELTSHRVLSSRMRQLQSARFRAENLNMPQRLILRSLHASLGN